MSYYDLNTKQNKVLSEYLPQDIKRNSKVLHCLDGIIFHMLCGINIQ